MISIILFDTGKAYRFEFDPAALPEWLARWIEMEAK